MVHIRSRGSGGGDPINREAARASAFFYSLGLRDPPSRALYRYTHACVFVSEARRPARLKEDGERRRTSVFVEVYRFFFV